MQRAIIEGEFVCIRIFHGAHRHPVSIVEGLAAFFSPCGYVWLGFRVFQTLDDTSRMAEHTHHVRM
jgi:hypothetical protein